MKIKKGVRLTPEFLTNAYMAYAVAVIEKTAVEGYEPTITSGNDGKHSEFSLHYADRAFDIRIRDYPLGRDVEWAALIREELGRDYDVILESDHIHIEYDPKDLNGARIKRPITPKVAEKRNDSRRSKAISAIAKVVPLDRFEWRRSH